MSETETAATRTASRSVTLPVLPEGWQYDVRITGPDGSIDVQPVLYTSPAPGKAEYTVEVRGKGRETRTLTKPNLGEALRGAAKAVKALNRLARHEAEARKARQSLLDEIGGEQHPEPEPEAPAKPAAQTPSTAPADRDKSR